MAEDITENSEMTQYQNRPNPLCIKANDRQSNNGNNFLDNNKKDLLKKYPQFGMADAASIDFFDTIIQRIFIDGIGQEVFIRNYTLDTDTFDEKKRLKLAMRYKRTPNDYFTNIMPDNKTLLFRGYVSGKYFVVDSVFEQYAEELLSYEVECRLTRYDNEQNGGNFLYDLAESTASLNEHTRKCLIEWKDYIAWRRTIVKKRMHGARYVNVENKDGNLAFTLQFPTKEAYDAESKWLRRSELAAYDYKDYSDENGQFEYNKESHRWKSVGSMARRYKNDGHEANGRYEIELVYAVPDNDDIEKLMPEEKEEYVEKQILPRYPQTGFLAPLVIKDLSLFKRLDRAVADLQQDKDCRSPNMAMWIFDVTRARLPKKEDRQFWENQVGNDWLNTNVANNPNQREAVFKMLMAPDLCLIQGPPGTGKTTVIAEAIYQFAKHGNRVLLASQSHDAVDNALERLANRSEIRAIRLSERDRDRDEERSKFGASKVLSTYYGTLSQSINGRFLNVWEENRRNRNACELELRDIQHVTADLETMNRNLTDTLVNIEECRRKLSEAENDLQKASDENTEHENAKRQYLNFRGIVERNKLSDSEIYIPNTMVNVLFSIFVPLIHMAGEQGVILISSVNDEVIKRDPALVLTRIAKSCDALFTLRDKLVTATQNADTDAGVARLKMQEIDEQIQQIREQLEEEDELAKRQELRKKRNELREEKEKLGESGAFVPSSDELALFDEERKAKIQTADGQAQMAQTISNIESAYKDALQEAINRMGSIIEAYQPQDTDSLSEQVKSYRGQIKQLTEDERHQRKEISVKEKLGETLAAKYSCDRSEIESRIENEMRRLDTEYDRDDSTRQVWQDSLKRFVEKLGKPETARYDEGYYKDTYISSCNVVGITCTANMKDLDEKFADFDVVIIDEVSKATPPELLPPLMRARKTILVGDHRQLPPVFNEYEKSYNELLEEINNDAEHDTDEGTSEMVLKKEDLRKYRDMVTSSLFREYFEKADESIKHSLLTQYRMHSDIQKVINRFYDGKLVSGVENENIEKAHGLNIKTDNGGSFLRSDSHAYWIDSSKFQGKIMEQSRYPGSTSLHNIFERYIILSILQKINDAYAAMGQSGITVGVISFYGSQVGDLRKAVKDMRNQGKLKSLKVDVNTVDRFQGKEKQVIITSLVCNTRQGNASHHVAAFERINVAFSRAQNLLIIVGAKDLYGRLVVPIPDMETGEEKKAHIYQNIIDDIARNGAFVPGDTLIAADDAQKIRDEYDKEAKER